MEISPTHRTVTPLSKILAIILFVTSTFIGLYIGYKYGQTTVIPSTCPTVVIPQPTKQLTIAQNIFNFKDIKNGDKFGDLTVKSIEPFDSSSPLSDKNYSIAFSGPITITGKYFQLGPNEMFGDRVGVCFSDVDYNSIEIIPREANDTGSPWFCFTNSAFADKELGTTGSGIATITIDDYTHIYYPSEVWDTATLVKVVKK